jgi:hypothetical protein
MPFAPDFIHNLPNHPAITQSFNWLLKPPPATPNNDHFQFSIHPPSAKVDIL